MSDEKQLSLIKPTNIVSKKNILIEKSYKLNTVELKLLSGIISLVNSLPKDKGGDVEFRTYRISVKDLHELLGFKSQGSLGDIKMAFLGLMKDIYNTEIIDSNNITSGDIVGGWIEKTSYIYKDGNGYFDVKLQEHLKEYLLGMKGGFTQYRLNNILNLQNPYSIRIYEFLKSGNKENKQISLEKLREMLQLGKKYPLFGNLKVKLLNIVVEEINDKTDINIEFNPMKEGKKIVGLDFNIIHNKKDIQNDDNFSEGPELITIENKLLNIGMLGKKLDELLIGYGRDKLEDNYILLLEQIKNGINIKNKVGWFIKSLEDSYVINDKETVITDLYKNNVLQEDLIKRIEKNNTQINRNAFKEWFESLGSLKREELMKEYAIGKPLQDKEMLIKARISSDFSKGLIK